MPGTPDEALARLVRDGVISAEQAMAVREALRESAAPARARWAEVAGYVGGGLVLAGALSLVATSWADLSKVAHMAILLAATVALLTAGIILLGARSRERATPPSDPGARSRERAATARSRTGSVSVALASVTAALAAAELVDVSAIAGAVGLLVGVLGYALARTAPLALACAFFAALTVGSLADDLTGGSALAAGLSLVVLGVVWTTLVLAGVIGQRPLGLGLGAVIALIGGQQDAGAVWAYTMTAAIAVACLLLYRRERAWVLLVAGVIGFTIAVPEAIWHWTGGAVGGSVIVMIAGAVLVTASVLGIRWHRT
ncbi:DUF2157 domain-containing protein [Nonomuraea sp. NPDC049504]|uniref:DUF2157 domain-containing protein n=1 Tax=Nonomuraea sp. NPDC049504 TaxID=3154729 RepID=UPI0034162857